MFFRILDESTIPYSATFFQFVLLFFFYFLSSLFLNFTPHLYKLHLRFVFPVSLFFLSEFYFFIGTVLGSSKQYLALALCVVLFQGALYLVFPHYIIFVNLIVTKINLRKPKNSKSKIEDATISVQGCQSRSCWDAESGAKDRRKCEALAWHRKEKPINKKC